MSGVKLGGRESDLTIPECGLAIMSAAHHGHLAGRRNSGATAASEMSTRQLAEVEVGLQTAI